LTWSNLLVGFGAVSPRGFSGKAGRRQNLVISFKSLRLTTTIFLFAIIAHFFAIPTRLQIRFDFHGFISLVRADHFQRKFSIGLRVSLASHFTAQGFSGLPGTILDVGILNGNLVFGASFFHFRRHDFRLHFNPICNTCFQHDHLL
jgi:hypothetical protein